MSGDSWRQLVNFSHIIGMTSCCTPQLTAAAESCPGHVLVPVWLIILSIHQSHTKFGQTRERQPFNMYMMALTELLDWLQQQALTPPQSPI